MSSRDSWNWQTTVMLLQEQNLRREKSRLLPWSGQMYTFTQARLSIESTRQVSRLRASRWASSTLRPVPVSCKQTASHQQITRSSSCPMSAREWSCLEMMHLLGGHNSLPKSDRSLGKMKSTQPSTLHSHSRQRRQTSSFSLGMKCQRQLSLTTALALLSSLMWCRRGKLVRLSALFLRRDLKFQRCSCLT